VNSCCHETVTSIFENYPGGWFARCAAALGQPAVVVQSNQRRNGHAAANRQASAAVGRARESHGAGAITPDLLCSRFVYSHGTGQRIGQWITQHILDRIPGFAVMRSMSRQLAGEKDEQSFQPALVEIEEALVPAFIMEKHMDGQFTVFVSSSPTPMAGAIYILQSERVHPVDVPLRKAMLCVTKRGAWALPSCVLRLSLET